MATTTLVAKETVAEGTMLFRFAKPTGFTFQAGQSIDLTLINAPETDTEGTTRAFSIAASPEEETLAIATRLRDTAFKRVLKDMPLGTEVSIEGPFGSFFLHEKVTRPAVFLAGGIGITPFRSMILDAHTRGLAHALTLFYSNRRPEDAAFLAELQRLEATYPAFTLVATMTESEKSSEEWQGERGYIDAAMLQRHIPLGTEPIYYLAGPPMMVTALRGVLTASGVSSDDIRFEQFAGY